MSRGGDCRREDVERGTWTRPRKKEESGPKLSLGSRRVHQERTRAQPFRVKGNGLLGEVDEFWRMYLDRKHLSIL